MDWFHMKVKIKESFRKKLIEKDIPVCKVQKNYF